MDEQDKKQPRARGLTSLTLGWIAERMRKAQILKAKIESGEYQIQTGAIASAIVNPEKPKQ
jgi:anti-sigma28 factor (negative regulator of flagellin synthesis)